MIKWCGNGLDRTFIGFNNESPEVCPQTASETLGIAFINIGIVEMSYNKISLTNAMEGKIANYCAKNNIEFNQAIAYDVVMNTFKDEPITIVDEDGEHTVTERIARLIECQPRTVERIADKAELYKTTIKQAQIKANIMQAKANSVPNIDNLVSNLLRLNIVDKNSYLALVCFLMQLKYSRDDEILENDKTCIFFNGVARNGKSATARAICNVESQYGTVFKAQSGKILESTHEEQVWKSHLNYFDEVKPTDIDREKLLTIVNGGDVEINPKNKKAYNYNVNTNNIFTSNDMISLKQRRVSIIKFGDRLGGRPLESGTLNKIITNIFNSLPCFDHYYDLYGIVSAYNENRVNPLAISNIITFLTEQFGFVNDTDERTLTATKIFAPHDIYNCIKGTYSKQTITSERKEAIRTALDCLVEEDLLELLDYKGTTKNYRVNGEQYLKIMVKYNNENTKDEENIKVSKTDLYNALAPFFDLEPIPDTDETKISNIKMPDYSWMESLNEMVEEEKRAKEHPVMVSADTESRGAMLYHHLFKQMDEMVNGTDKNGNTITKHPIDFALKQCITRDVCKNISYKWLTKELHDNIIGFDNAYDNLVKELYMHNLGLTDENTLDAFEPYKLSEIQRGCKDGMTIESSWDFNQRKHKGKLEQRNILAKEARERKNEEWRKKLELEEGPMPTRKQMEAFKLALKQQPPKNATSNV